MSSTHTPWTFASGLGLRLGPPPVPLPDGWADALELPRLKLRTEVRRILRLERQGSPRVCRRLHARGYVEVYLGRHHPYARRSGVQSLHRWLMMRTLGRVLQPYEHVHHLPNAPKDTTDVTQLEILHDTLHGQHHYGMHFVRTTLGTLAWVGCDKRHHMTEEEMAGDDREGL